MLKRRELLTPPEVEELYGLKEGTLKVWRCRGGGPRVPPEHEERAGALFARRHTGVSQQEPGSRELRISEISFAASFLLSGESLA